MENYKNRHLSPQERAEDLCTYMNLDEKIAQLLGYMPIMAVDNNGNLKEEGKQLLKNGIGRFTQFASVSFSDPSKTVKAYNAIQKYCVEETRLGIPFMSQAECINGIIAPYGAPFPSPMVLASTFNKELASMVGYDIGEQNNAIGVNIGLFPQVDLAREPRWGRITETFGEDAYLSAVMAVEEAKSYQKFYHHECLGKHFLGFSQQIQGADTAEIAVSEHTLREEFAYPWEAMFHEADVKGVMVTYGNWNGIPISVNKDILQNLLRNKLGFTGSAICDGGSLIRVFVNNRVGKSEAEVAAMAIQAGLSADTPHPDTYTHLKEAIDLGYIKESEIDEQVKIILEQKFRLGLFDDPYIDEDKVKEMFVKGRYDEHVKKVLYDGITLLKNEDDILPLNESNKDIAIIGPFADSFKDFFGGYTFPAYAAMNLGMIKKQEKGNMMGVTDDDKLVQKVFAQSFRNAFDEDILAIEDPLEAKEMICKQMYHGKTVVQAVSDILGKKVKTTLGTNFTQPSDTLEEAIQLAKESDTVILTLGETCGWGSDSMSGEGKTRLFDLPQCQIDLIEEVLKVNQNIILVLFIGRPIVLPEAARKCKALINMWMPSAFGGECLADILYGKVNPSGKLPITMPASFRQTQSYYCQLPGRRESIGEDGYADPALYPFGFGLSYTTFMYSNLKITSNANENEIEVSCKVKNTGNVTGKEVVQLYFNLRGRSVARPIKQLVGFEKIELKPMEEREIIFTVPTDILAYETMDKQFGVESGYVRIYIGGDSENAALIGECNLDKTTYFDCHRKHFSSVVVK